MYLWVDLKGWWSIGPTSRAVCVYAPSTVTRLFFMHYDWLHKTQLNHFLRIMMYLPWSEKLTMLLESVGIFDWETYDMIAAFSPFMTHLIGCLGQIFNCSEIFKVFAFPFGSFGWFGCRKKNRISCGWRNMYLVHT